MAVNEAAKHDLYEHVKETWGDERAHTLMAMVSPTGWEDVATKQDLALLRTEMHAEFKLVRTEMAGEFAKVRTEMAGEFAKVRTEMAGEFAKVRSEMAGEFANVRNDMEQFVTKAYLEKAMRTQLYAIYVFNGIFMSLAVGLAQAIGG